MALIVRRREECSSDPKAYSRFGNLLSFSAFSRLFDVKEGTPEPKSQMCTFRTQNFLCLVLMQDKWSGMETTDHTSTNSEEVRCYFRSLTSLWVANCLTVSELVQLINAHFTPLFSLSDSCFLCYICVSLMVRLKKVYPRYNK